jgi:hypothetical protein
LLILRLSSELQNLLPAVERFPKRWVLQQRSFQSLWQAEKEQVLKTCFPAFYDDARELIRYRKDMVFVQRGLFFEKMKGS